jgi:hypothetical protein
LIMFILLDLRRHRVTGAPASHPMPLPAANDPAPGRHYRYRTPSLWITRPILAACAPANRKWQ